MKRFYLVLVSIITVMFLFSCEENITSTIYEVEPKNGYARLPYIGNFEVVLDFEALGGSAVNVYNANDQAAGVYIEKKNEPGVVLFSDGWIASRDAETRRGVHYEYGWEIKVSVVVYNKLSQAIQALIRNLGGDFLLDLEEVWIRQKYEKTIIISAEK